MNKNAKRIFLASVFVACLSCLAWKNIRVHAEECTGKQEKADCMCGTERECEIQGTGCNTKLLVFEHTCCVDGDPADNCQTVQGQQLCARRWSCVRHPNSCLTGEQIGSSTAPNVSSAGNCTISG